MNTMTLRLPLRRSSGGAGETGGALAALWARWRHYLRLRETRRYLQQMDEHMLNDIGVSRAQAMFEVDRVG